MKRKGFLKSLATFIAAPSLIESIDGKKEVVPYIQKAYEIKEVSMTELRQYPFTYDECYTPQQIIEIYNQTGNLIYQSKH